MGKRKSTHVQFLGFVYYNVTTFTSKIDSNLISSVQKHTKYTTILLVKKKYQMEKLN